MNDIWRIVNEGPDTPAVRFGIRAIQDAAERAAGCRLPASGHADGNAVRLSLAAPEDGVPEDGYRIRVTEPEGECQTARIIGYDGIALMYGCMDFAGKYLSQASLSRKAANPYYVRPLFTREKLPETDCAVSPSVARRGLWTWGLAVYDWRGYLENMARLKLNEVIIWNDFAPTNGREIAARAHELGIRVIWGYAWGWDTTMKLDVSEEASQAIADRYEREYADLGGDGIYFQSFTETKEETLGGRLIAEAVVEFVNRTAGKLFSRHPNLRIQFGLHAESVKHRLEYIAHVDPRLEIIWENCGDFPWHTMPDRTDRPEETRDLMEKILTLRPEAGDGAVLKSMIQLDWGHFRHQEGPAALGCADEATIRAREEPTKRIWRYIAGEWIDHGEKCLDTVRRFAERGNTALYNLLEDGLFERMIPLSAALYAECCFDCRRDWHTILRECIQQTEILI